MRYQKKAQKPLDKLSDKTAQPIIDGISSLETNPRPIGCRKLNDRDSYLLRIGVYRVIYEIFDSELLVDVIALVHRKDIYE